MSSNLLIAIILKHVSWELYWNIIWKDGFSLKAHQLVCKFCDLQHEKINFQDLSRKPITLSQCQRWTCSSFLHCLPLRNDSPLCFRVFSDWNAFLSGVTVPFVFEYFLTGTSFPIDLCSCYSEDHGVEGRCDDQTHFSVSVPLSILPGVSGKVPGLSVGSSLFTSVRLRT